MRLLKLLQPAVVRACVRKYCTEPIVDNFTPRRACLYVPGNNAKMLAKIPTIGADCAVLDCEDGVAVNMKEEARNTILKTLEEMDFGSTEPAVRINSIQSGLAELDLKVILQTKKAPLTLLLPKVESPSQIEWIESKITSTLKELKIKRDHIFNLIIYTESPVGVLKLEEICKKAAELSDLGAFVKLSGVVFGSDDFCASIGATRTSLASEVSYVRQKVVLIAKAYGLQAIDVVYIDYKDLDGLRRQCIEGVGMGYTGKQVIHPSQVPIVQEIFAPSREQIEWATQLIEGFEQHQKDGKGAYTFRGHMIDMPLVLQAINILRLKDRLQQPK